MALDWPPVKESHAQLLTAGFNAETTDPNGGIVGGAEGFLCDYTGPWNGGCRPFWVQFHIFADGSERVRWGAALVPSGNPTDHVVDFWVGSGAFALTYAGPTGP